MSKIVIGEAGSHHATIDVDKLLRTRLLVQANSGKGKSWLLRRIAEQIFGKVQILVIDPEGEFATLREKYGYVLVGKGGDTPADPRSAALLAHKLLELRASAVCDIYELKPAQRHEWVQRFLDALIDAPKNLWHPCVVMVDEAHTFCPEKGSGESIASEAMIGLATRGRKRGYASIFATQRLGKLRKDAAAELLNVMIGGTFIDVDRKRAADALGVYGSADLHAFFDEIKVLERGSFFALGPAISDERILVKIGPVETTHPEAGSSRHAAEPPPAPEKVKAMLPKLADLPRTAEDKARTEAELKKEIRELKAQLRDQSRSHPVQKLQPSGADLKAIERAVKQALERQRMEFSRTYRASLKQMSAEVEQWLRVDPTKVLPRVSGEKIQQEENSQPKVPVSLEGNRTPKHSLPRDSEEGEVRLKAGARKMLTILAQWHPEPKTRDELGALAGFSPNGGTFGEYLSKLRIAGYIVENGAGIELTDDGMAMVGAIPERPDSTEALVAMWKQKFKAGVGKMLDVLVGCYPDAISREELGNMSGYAASGGTFGEYLSNLRRARLIEEPSGAVQAARSLFPGVYSR